MFAFLSAPLNTTLTLCSFGSLLKNKLGEGADTIVAFASEMPQIVTLCGIQPEQTAIDVSRMSYEQELDAGDAKLLAFDLSKNHTIKTVKYAA